MSTPTETRKEDVDHGRAVGHSGHGPHGVEAVLRPRSIAVIGASRQRGTIGAEIFRNLIDQEFNGPVYPINPKSTVVQSVPAYARIGDVPGEVDLAIIVVPAAFVLSVLEECGAKGVRAAVIISAGFKEVGAEGRAREDALIDCAHRHGIRLVGPNCMGVLNTESEVRMDGTFAPIYPPPGRIGFLSQSGALGLAILEHARQIEVGISQFASVGNKADISGNDLVEFWEDDPGTDVILLYLESFGNPRRFSEIARRVSRKKPIVAVKSGRTAAGARAASSHTGALAGTEAGVDALFHRTGMVRTDTIEELFDVAMLLANQPVPAGPRVAILTNAGGPGILAADACESYGLEIPPLDAGTIATLKSFLPNEASTRNPIDMIASATPETYEHAVELLLRDPNIDALLAIYVTPIVTAPAEVAAGIIRGAAKAKSDGAAPKPVLTCFMGSHGVPEGLRSLQDWNIPSYPFPEDAAKALARVVRHGRWLSEPEGRVIEFADVDHERARKVIAGVPPSDHSSWLTNGQSRELLGAYGITTPGAGLARSARATADIASSLGYPVAIKLASDTITHKSDVGGVVLDVRSDEEAMRAFREIEGNLKDAGRLAEMSGVTVQQMITDGVEAIIGVTHDPQFGALVMFGLGGVYVELLKDVVFRLHPLTDHDARQMIREVRGFKLLEGYRGAPPGDLAALEQALMRVSQMIEDHPDIVEMDLNPLVVRPPGHGCIAVDARIAVRVEA